MTDSVASSVRDDPLAATMLEDPFDASLDFPPYPGLRPFVSAEWPIFFGRETMTDEIIDLVTKKHLVVVHGDSGSGKSSIVRAGVLVQLQQGHAATEASWRTCALLPREDPLGNLARALAGLLADEPTPEQILDVRHILNRGRRAPRTLARRVRRGKSDHICILVDQFEELFTLAKWRSPEETRLFVDVLVGLQQKPTRGLFAIVTMRSEFLGHCARFEGLAEAVNQTQYLLPRMERPALLRAICEPAPLYGGEVSQELAERLIADAAGSQDQLPLIQHGLMRLWRDRRAPRRGDTTPAESRTARPDGDSEQQPSWGFAEAATPYQHHHSSESPVRLEIDEAPLPFRRDDGPVWRLGLEDYQDAGGLTLLLSDHADEVMAKAAPDPDRQKIVEHLFRALTDINAEGQAIRRPQTFAELAAVTGSDALTLEAIIDHFRVKGVFFLTPYGDARLKPGTLIDISHEALIRCWQKIAEPKDGWLQREFRDGLAWKTLRMQAQSGETLSAAATEARDVWLNALPSQRWSERYDNAWDDVDRLMIASRRTRDKELQRKRELEEAKRREAEARAHRAEEAHRAAEEIAAKQQELREAQERIAEEQRQRAEAEQQRAAEAEAHVREADAGRRRSRRLAIAASVFGFLAFAAALTAGLMWWQATRAEAKAQLGDSLYRAEQARKHLKDNLPITAMQLALAGLPESPTIPAGRPWVGETAGALVEAMDAQRELKVLKGHGGSVRSVAFSPQGDRIVSGEDDGTVRLWQLHGRSPGKPFKGHEGSVRSVAFSARGDRIVSGGDDGTVRLWQLDGRPAGKPVQGHEGSVRSVAFSPQGDQIVSGGDDGTVRLWQLDGRPAGEAFQGHRGSVLSVAFSRQGDRIVSGGADGTVRLWQLDGRPAGEPFQGHGGGLLSVAFSPGGDRIVSGGDDGTVRLWQLDGRPAGKPFPGHDGGVLSVAFSPEGDRIVSGGRDDTVRLWQLDGRPAGEPFQGHDGSVRSVAFSAQRDRIVSGGDDGTVRLWQLDGPPAEEAFQGHRGSVLSVAFSPQGDQIVSGGWDDTVRLWQLDGRPAGEAFQGHRGSVLSVAFSPGGDRIVSGGADGTVRLWQLDGHPAGKPFQGHGGGVLSVAFSRQGGRIVSGGDDGTVRLWRLDGRPAGEPFQGHGGGVLSVAFSPEGDRIVSGGDDGAVRLWQLDGRPAGEPFLGHDGSVRSVAFSPVGDRIVSGGDDGTVRLWQLDGRPAGEAFQGHDGSVRSVAFSPVGDRIVSGGDDGTVRLWDAASGEELLVLRCHEKPVSAAELSPNGVLVVSGSDDNTLRLTWVGGSKQELIGTARLRLPRALTDEQRRRYRLELN